MGLPKNRRLRRSPEFRRVFKRGTTARDKLISITAAAEQPQSCESRFGLSVSKRVGGAVVRNRVKRRLKHVAKASGPKAGWDYVITARPPAADADSRQLAGSMAYLLKELGLDAPKKKRV